MRVSPIWATRSLSVGKRDGPGSVWREHLDSLLRQRLNIWDQEGHLIPKIQYSCWPRQPRGVLQLKVPCSKTTTKVYHGAHMLMSFKMNYLVKDIMLGSRKAERSTPKGITLSKTLKRKAGSTWYVCITHISSLSALNIDSILWFNMGFYIGL